MAALGGAVAESAPPALLPLEAEHPSGGDELEQHTGGAILELALGACLCVWAAVCVCARALVS